MLIRLPMVSVQDEIDGVMPDVQQEEQQWAKYSLLPYMPILV